MLEIIDRTGRRREVQDVVHWPVDLQRQRHIVMEECKACIGRRCSTFAAASGDEVVDADDVVAVLQKSFAKVGADKARAAGDECAHE